MWGVGIVLPPPSNKIVWDFSSVIVIRSYNHVSEIVGISKSAKTCIKNTASLKSAPDLPSQNWRVQVRILYLNFLSWLLGVLMFVKHLIGCNLQSQQKEKL